MTLFQDPEDRNWFGVHILHRFYHAAMDSVDDDIVEVTGVTKGMQYEPHRWSRKLVEGFAKVVKDEEQSFTIFFLESPSTELHVNRFT